MDENNEIKQFEKKFKDTFNSSFNSESSVKSVTDDKNSSSGNGGSLSNSEYNNLLGTQEGNIRGFPTSISDVKQRNRNDLLRVTNVTNVTNVTDNVTNVTNVIRNTYVVEALGKGILELIFVSLYNQSPKTYEQISAELGKDKEVIRVTIARQPNKDYFVEDSKEGKSKLFSLSSKAIQYIQERISQYEKKQTHVIESISKEEQRLRSIRELENDCRNILRAIKFEKIGDSLYFNFNDLVSDNVALADKLLDEPDLVLGTLKSVSNYDKLDFRVTNLPNDSILSIEKVRGEHLNKLIVIEGRVVSISDVRPVIIKSTFECPNCGSVISKIPTDNIVTQPARCTCGWKSTFKLLNHETVNSANITLEDLQENTDSPNLKRMRCVIRRDFTDHRNISVFTPGNEIKTIGVLRPVNMFMAGRQKVELGQIFEIMHAELFEPEISSDNFKEEDRIQVIEVSKKIDVEGLSVLNTSFAPQVYGHDSIKQAIMLQLCNRRNDPKKGGIRNKPNILLIGDPGVSKSVLANFALDITPGARKAVGGGSSAVGITASVVKEEESMGGYRVEPGALVLAKELLVLDELNNLAEDDKPKLQESMSEQTVTINKANLHVKLKVTAGVIGTANPKDGKFNENTSIVSQFNIPVPIINRFDEIFVIQDKPNEKEDQNIAKKMIERERQLISPLYPKEFLRKFFVYIRNQPEPEIDEDISNLIQKLYSKIRKSKDSEVIINARFVEAITRLIKASAKIRLSNKVEKKDIERAMEILSKSHFKTPTYNLEEFK